MALLTVVIGIASNAAFQLSALVIVVQTVILIGARQAIVREGASVTPVVRFER